MSTIKAIIADDEETGWKSLKNMLSDLTDEIEVVAVATSAASAIQQIKKHEPSLIFLDINMPDGDGFKVLEQTSGIPYEVIFVTAHHEFAVKAFEFSALHYLLKPVNIHELKEVLDRYYQKRSDVMPEKLGILKTALQNQYTKIALPTQDSIIFVQLDDIIRCEASHNYTVFYFRDKTHVVMSKSLLHYEKLLGNTHFFRIHDKHLINLKYVMRYNRGKGGTAILSDGTELEVSVRKKEDFLKRISMHMG